MIERLERNNRLASSACSGSGFFILIASALTAAACGEAEPVAEAPTADEQVAEAEENLATAEAVVEASPDLAKAQAFIENFATSSALQIGLADIAGRDAEREAVQDFARRTSTLYKDLAAGLKAAADETSEDLSFNTSLDEEQEEDLAEMRGALSADDMFLDRTRQLHERLQSAVSAYAGTAADSPIKRWADEAQAQIAAHRDELIRL